MRYLLLKYSDTMIRMMKKLCNNWMIILWLLLAGSISYCLSIWIFCALVTVGILLVTLKYFYPDSIKRDDRYYIPRRRTPGRISASDIYIATIVMGAIGMGPMGIFED